MVAGCSTILSAAQYYAAPSGSPSGTGSQSSPWDLATALSKTGVIAPGDTLWLRGGTYKGTFTSNLAGSPSAPVIVRQYPGERATIDGSPSSNPPLSVFGSNTWYWGFEVMNSDAQRVSAQTGSAPTDLKRGIGVWVEGPGTKFINMIVHDTTQGFGFWSDATGAEIYGALIYANGWDAPDRGHGHGIYVQNATPSKYITNNIIFNQFGYGIQAYTANGSINNITTTGNILFNNGILSAVSGNTRNLLMGGGSVAQNLTVSNNYTYYSGNQGQNYLGYDSGCQNLTATGNYFAGGADALILGTCPGAAITSNTLYGPTSGLSAFPNNTYLTSRPANSFATVIPNKYEAGRANIVVYNWALQNSVAVDPSGVLSIGDSYQILDAQNIFGAPALSGVYNGGTILLPTNQTAIAAAIGNDPVPPTHTGPEFGAFVLIRTGQGAGAGNQAPVVNAGPAQTITLPASAVLNGTASDDGLPNNSLTTAWSKTSGPGTVTFANGGAASTTATFSAAGTYVLTLTASDGALSSSSSVTVTVNAAGGSVAAPAVLIDAGGPSFTDSQGQVWSADTYFSGGYTYTTSAPIAGTTAQGLYQSTRYGNFTYTVPAPNGAATVILKFAEPYFSSKGQRVFNVSINGQQVLTNFDLVAAAGAFTAIDKQFTTNVTNGQVTIQFAATVNYATISAIQVVPGGGGATFTPIHVNAGGAGLTAADGTVWSADTGYSGGSTYATSTAIANTPSPNAYQTERFGAFSYQFAVPNGGHTVQLRFAEIYFTTPGQRVFNVAINGQTVLSNFDIVAVAGAAYTPVTRQFPVNVTNGQVKIDFIPVVENPKVSGVEVIQ